MFALSDNKSKMCIPTLEMRDVVYSVPANKV